MSNNYSFSADRQKQIDAYVKEVAAKKLSYMYSLNPDDAKKYSASIFLDEDVMKNSDQMEYSYEIYAQEILNSYNRDGDSKVTVKEMGTAEAEHLITNGAQEDIAKRSGNLFAQNMDINGDGIIDIEEFKFFQKTADGMGGELDGKMDGKILAGSEAVLFESIQGLIVDDKDLQKVTEKYLAGDNLTKDEQDILNKGSVTIRTAMSKSAQKDFKLKVDAPIENPRPVYLGDIAKPQTTDILEQTQQAQDSVAAMCQEMFGFNPNVPMTTAANTAVSTQSTESKDASKTTKKELKNGQVVNYLNSPSSSYNMNMMNSYGMNPYAMMGSYGMGGMGGMDSFGMMGMGMGMGMPMMYSPQAAKANSWGMIFGGAMGIFGGLSLIAMGSNFSLGRRYS